MDRANWWMEPMQASCIIAPQLSGMTMLPVLAMVMELGASFPTLITPTYFQSALIYCLV
jgi:hypothetical protein